MKNIMVKKVLAAACAVAMFPAAVPVFAGTGSSVSDTDKGVVGKIYRDFESFDVDTVFSGDPEAGVISTETAGTRTYSIVNDNGNKVLKVREAAGGSAGAGVKLLTSSVSSSLETADYWVIKYDLKNGDSAANAYGYIWQQLQFRNDGESLEYPNSSNKISFTPYVYHEFMFIGNPATGKVKLVLDGTAYDELNCDRISSVGDFYGIQIYDMYSGHSNETVMYIDDMEIYGLIFDVGCSLDKLDAVQPSDTIVVKAEGYVDETSLNTVTVSSTTDTSMSVASRSYDADKGELTLTLSKEMDQFTSYKVDMTGIKSKNGYLQSDKTATFKTTGDLDIENTVSVADNKLKNGTNVVTMSVKNITPIDASLTLILELVEGGKTKSLAYKDATILENETDSLSATFVAGEGAQVKAYVKNAVNGVIAYGDEITVSASGIDTKPAENITEAYPSVDVSKDKGFYQLTLGVDGERKKLTKVKDCLVECTSDVGSSEGVLIAVVKKNGRLVDYSFAKGSGVLHAAVSADKTSTVEMYTWGDEAGTTGRSDKATLAAN